MLSAAAAVLLTAIAANSTAHAAASALQRNVQIVEVDFVNSTITLQNLHATDGVAIGGWRFCSHDEDQVRRYSAGMPALTLAPGESLRIHFLNDSEGAEGEINRTGIGGSFALPLDSGAYGIQLYDGGSFGSGANIVDHLQWSIGGADDANADDRSDEAQSGGVWSNQGQWISTLVNTEKIVLTSPDGGTVLHGPADYTVINPADTITVSGLVKDGAVITADVVAEMNVDVYRSTDLMDFGTIPVRSNVVPGDGVQIDDAATGPVAYYLLVPTGSPAP